MKRNLFKILCLAVVAFLLATSFTGCAYLLENETPSTENFWANQSTEADTKNNNSVQQKDPSEKELPETAKETSIPNNQQNNSPKQETADKTEDSSQSQPVAHDSGNNQQNSSPKQETADKTENSSQSQPTTHDSGKEKTVWITPTGKRYHATSTCGGKNSTPVSLTTAKEKGLTPCSKCW